MDDGPSRDMVLWSWEEGAEAVGAGAGANIGAGVGMRGWLKADMVLWRSDLAVGCWTLKSGVIERRCCCISGPVKGLVLLGRAGTGSVRRGLGEARSVS